MCSSQEIVDLLKMCADKLKQQEVDQLSKAVTFGLWLYIALTANELQQPGGSLQSEQLLYQWEWASSFASLKILPFFFQCAIHKWIEDVLTLDDE